MAKVAVAALWLAACSGGGGVSASDFVNKIDDTCRALDRDLARPASSAEVAGFAADASKSFEDALASLKKLAVPSGNTATVGDAKALLANMDDQIDLLDDIAAAASAADQATVDTKTAAFDALVAANSDLADSLGAKRCALDPLFANIAPPVTEPPVTEAPTTVPPVTAPPVTAPPVTTPVVTTPTGSNKTVVTLADQVAANGGFTFTDVNESLIGTFTILLDISAQTGAQPGKVAAIEVYDGGTAPVSRIFVYLPDAALPHSAVDELATILAGDSPVAPATLGGLDGVAYTPTDGGVFFVAANDPTTVGFIIWAVGQSQEALDGTISAFLSGLGG